MVPAGSPSLDVVQRWLLDVITHPQGVAAGVSSAAAQSSIPLTLEQLNDVILPSEKRTSLERLAVYGDAYHARLIECLATEFPATRRLAGAEAFGNFVIEYVTSFPSRSYTLARLGDHFAEHLQRTRPPRAAAESSPDWADLLVDVARVERCLSEVFDGPGDEETQTASQAPPAADPLCVQLRTAQSLRLLEVRFPVLDVLREFGTGTFTSPPQPRATFLAIHRRDYRVWRRELSPAAHAFLGALHSAEPLGAAVGAAAACWEGPAQELPVAIQDWCHDWTSAGILLGTAG